ncbi:MAG: DHA2 family efflux MFS transporter permease subunit [Chloroflexi bacterium]|nr:DHA2 family efflux MFS transporter permease subunit [Chloroflexota bacterium]
MRGLSAVVQEPPPLASLTRLPSYSWLIVGTVCVGAFLGQLDASIAGLVLPTLEETFASSVAGVEWVAIAYLVTLAALVVPLGRLADLAGRKLLYVTGFLVFIGGSALCGFSPNLGWLIVFRVVQAVGAAMLQANSVAIITAAVARRKLGRAIGIQGAAQAVGLSVGPSVGGFLIDALGWRWVFFIAVPFGLIGTVLGWLVLPTTVRSDEQADKDREHFDWVGALLLGPSVALFMLALTFANDWGWTSPAFLGVTMLAAVCLGLFVATEFRARSPLVDLTLFASRMFTIGIVAGLLSYSVLFGSLFLIPFYLERILGRTPAEAGLLLTPIPLALGIMAPLSGALTDRFGSRLPTVTGMLLSALALLALALLPDSGLPLMLVLLGVLGVGLGLFTPPNNSAIMGSAPQQRLGVAGGILNMTRSIGTSLGVALTGAVLALLLSALTGTHVDSTVDVDPAALEVAFHQTLFCLGLLAVAAGLLSAVRGAPTLEAVPAHPTAMAESIGL